MRANGGTRALQSLRVPASFSPNVLSRVSTIQVSTLQCVDKSLRDPLDKVLQLALLVQDLEQVGVLDEAPHALEVVPTLGLGDDEPERVELCDDREEVLVAWDGLDRGLVEEVEVPADDLPESKRRVSLQCQGRKAPSTGVVWEEEWYRLGRERTFSASTSGTPARLTQPDSARRKIFWCRLARRTNRFEP